MKRNKRLTPSQKAAIRAKAGRTGSTGRTVRQRLLPLEHLGSGVQVFASPRGTTIKEQHYIHRKANGLMLRISDMDDSHLANTIALHRRREALSRPIHPEELVRFCPAKELLETTLNEFEGIELLPWICGADIQIMRRVPLYLPLLLEAARRGLSVCMTLSTASFPAVQTDHITQRRWEEFLQGKEAQAQERAKEEQRRREEQRKDEEFKKLIEQVKADAQAVVQEKVERQTRFYTDLFGLPTLRELHNLKVEMPFKACSWASGPRTRNFYDSAPSPTLWPG